MGGGSQQIVQTILQMKTPNVRSDNAMTGLMLVHDGSISMM